MPVCIIAVEFFPYRVPLTSDFVWAWGTVHSVINIVTIVRGELDGVPIHGIGESAPRGPALTGDIWHGIGRVYRTAGDRLCGSVVPTSDPSASIRFIAEFMHGLAQSIPATGSYPEGFKPYRGTLCGIEMALLDLAARAQGVRVAELLGRQRNLVHVSSLTLADRLTRAETAEQLKDQVRRFPICRIKGSGGDGAEDIRQLTTIAEIHRELVVERPLWIDINGAYSVEMAHRFVDEVANLARRDLLPKLLLIEQPVPKEELKALSALQTQADGLAANYGGEIVIMADETVWDSEDLTRLHQAGGCRAINIKIQKAGGLVEALRTAELSAAQDPNRRTYIGGFPGTGDVTAWAAVNLGLTLPRLDYFTHVVPNRVAHRIARPLCRFVDEASNRIADPTGPGLGVEIDVGALRPLLQGYYRVPQKKAADWPAAWHVRLN